MRQSLIQHSAIHRQKGNKAVLLLVLLVAGIIGLAYFFKSNYGQNLIADVKNWVSPGSSTSSKTVSRQQETVSPVRVDNGDRVILSQYHHDREPAQQYYDQAPTTYAQPQRKYVPERVRNKLAVADPPSDFGYDVQLMATRDQGAAHAVKDAFRRDGFAEAFVEPVWRGNVKMFRVKLGHYKHRSDATKMRDKVRRRYPERFSQAIVISSDK